jgi:hypothetical protein
MGYWDKKFVALLSCACLGRGMLCAVARGILGSWGEVGFLKYQDRKFNTLLEQ